MEIMACISCDRAFNGTGKHDEVCPYCDSEAIVPHDCYRTAPYEEIEEDIQQSIDEYKRTKFKS